MNTDRTFILTTTDRTIEIVKYDSGDLSIYGGTLVSRADAEQISIGIQAILSGQFDRACSEETLRFDLARRNPSLRSSSASTPQPSLGDL